MNLAGRDSRFELVLVGPQTSAKSLNSAFEGAVRNGSDAVLLWDPSLGLPDYAVVQELLGRTAEVHHAGLLLGQAGRPRAVDFVEPLWMHNCDVPPDRESTSWRISFRACLIRTTVLRQLEPICEQFHSLDAAALELGFRWLRRGVFIRHNPLLLNSQEHGTSSEIDAHDEMLFAYRCFGSSWMAWAAARAALTGAWSPVPSARYGAESARWSMPRQQTFGRERLPVSRKGNERVTMIVPTIERYPYLRVLLEQLRTQTVRPHEVIVIDQTPKSGRDAKMPTEFADLPLRWITLDRAGQCSSRNAGLLAATGDHLLFVDDDDEVNPDLIQLHLEALARFDSDVSCGVANEVGIPSLPENFTFTRASDVFPTNNTMVRRSVLERTGLFDLAYDRQQRADADLGMRAHLSGAFMVLNPEIDVLHHHAPRGGLREHGARVITYASSRNKLWQRHLPSPSELYLGSRYFGDARVREAMWQRAFGTLSGHGASIQRLAKSAIGAMLMPDTVRRIQLIRASAQQMLEHREPIPHLSPAEAR